MEAILREKGIVLDPLRGKSLNWDEKLKMSVYFEKKKSLLTCFQNFQYIFLNIPEIMDCLWKLLHILALNIYIFYKFFFSILAIILSAYFFLCLLCLSFEMKISVNFFIIVYPYQFKSVIC